MIAAGSVRRAGGGARSTAFRWRSAALAAALCGGLVAAMALRLDLDGSHGGTSRPAGLLFAGALVGLALLAGWRPGRLGGRALLIGLGGAAAICALSVPHRLAAGIPGIPRPPWDVVAPWSAVTLLVAVAEEVLLRGALFDAAGRAAGDVAAVLVTGLAFALIHVPIYGMGALPLDLGVGILLGTLRVAGGGVTAPATAHAAADLAIWWVW